MSTSLAIELRPLGLDRFGDLRHIHIQAYKAYLGPELSEDQLEGLIRFVQTPDYVELLLATECVGAWVGDRLCATGSWMPGGAAGASAKLVGLCVDPLFGGLGLARRLVDEIEARAKRAGFSVISARAPVMVAPFFERLGYLGGAKGVWALPGAVSVPVIYMRKGDGKVMGSQRRLSSSAVMPAKMPSSVRVH